MGHKIRWLGPVSNCNPPSKQCHRVAVGKEHPHVHAHTQAVSSKGGPGVVGVANLRNHLDCNIYYILYIIYLVT